MNEPRVNHRLIERDLCARIRAGDNIHPHDLLYLADRLIRLRTQLEAEWDLNELEVAARQEAMRANAELRWEREMLSEPIE